MYCQRVTTPRLPIAAFAVALVAAPCLAQDASVREEVVDRDGRAVGFIDWTEQKVYARADGATASEAAAAARQLLYQVLLVVTVDDATCVGDRVRQFAGLDADLRALVENAQVTQSYRSAAGQTVFVVTPLFGKSGLYATLMKPHPVRVTPALPFAPVPEPPAASVPAGTAPSDLPSSARSTPPVAAPAPGSQPAAPSASLPARQSASPAVPAQPPNAAVAKTQPKPLAKVAVATPNLTRIARAQGLSAPWRAALADGRTGSAAPVAATTHPTKPKPVAPASTKRQQSHPQAVALAPAARPGLPPTPQFAPLDVPTKGPFTGLLVDARGLNLKRCISPLILTESGQTIYGHFDNMTPAQLQYAHDTGTVSYLPDPAFALKSRAGARPLVVRGLRVDGVYSGNVVVSDGDGERALAADRTAGFLAKMNVAMLK